MEQPRYRILVADDHAVVRRGILQILQDAPDLSVEGEAASGHEVIDRVRQHEWDAIVMDLSMPGTTGIDLVRQVHAIRPGLPLLIMSVHPEDQYALRLLRAGASGYITKETLPDELIRAVRRVCAKGRYVSPALAEQLAFTLGSDSERPPHEKLSDREFEVLRLLASGLTPTEISNRLCLSVKTVSTYRARILDKMQMRTSAELMRYALQAGLVD